MLEKVDGSWKLEAASGGECVPMQVAVLMVQCVVGKLEGNF